MPVKVDTKNKYKLTPGQIDIEDFEKSITFLQKQSELSTDTNIEKPISQQITDALMNNNIDIDAPNESQQHIIILNQIIGFPKSVNFEKSALINQYGLVKDASDINALKKIIEMYRTNFYKYHMLSEYDRLSELLSEINQSKVVIQELNFGIISMITQQPIKDENYPELTKLVTGFEIDVKKLQFDIELFIHILIIMFAVTIKNEEF